MATATPSSKPPKPAILCLHGGGTSAAIFTIQTIRLRALLSPYFDFVFLDAPFHCTPGPGVLPVFENCEPFCSWTSPHKDPLTNVAALETTELLEDELGKRKRQTGRAFVGVMGFSQGARTAAGLLQYQEELLRKHSGDWSALKDDQPQFKFAILLMGTTSPLGSLLASVEARNLKIETIPTLHTVGKVDPFRDATRLLFKEWFVDESEGGKARKIELDVGHNLPAYKEGTHWIAREIVGLFESTTGEKFGGRVKENGEVE